MHYTLNTGHSRFSPRDEVSIEVIAACRPWIETGRHTLPVPGWSLQTGQLERGLICTLWHSGVPAVTFAIAASEQYSDAIWSEFEKFYLTITDLPGHRAADWKSPKKPSPAPWVAAVIVSPLHSTDSWIGDFERCVAWAFMESLQ